MYHIYFVNVNLTRVGKWRLKGLAMTIIVIPETKGRRGVYCRCTIELIILTGQSAPVTRCVTNILMILMNE
jgi:hypothetical protein